MKNYWGRVVIDLQGIFDGSVTTDTIVEDGDTLFVPKYSNTISVIGEVYEPGTFRFEEGLTLERVKESIEFQCGQYESRRGWRCDCHTH